MADDMNYGGGGPGAKMPFLDALGTTGAVFTAAYGDHPICAPSRASIMSGIRGGVSGYYMGRWGNYEAALSDAYKWWDNPVLANSMEIPEFFRSKCYYVAGTGKVNHDEKPEAGCADCLWDEFFAQTDYGPYANDGTKDTYHDKLPDALAQISSAIDYGWARLSQVPYENNANAGWKYAGGKKMGGPRGMFKFNSVDDRDPTSDEYNAAWAIQKIEEWEQSKPDVPWLLMVGFVKPHTPLHCPDEHFNSFPLDEVVLPEGWDEDASDTFYEAAVTKYNNGFKLAHALKDSYPGGFEEGLKRWMQAYYACVEFVDKQVGKVVSALNSSKFSSNTIIVFMADNGWQNGAKQYVYKNSPWEEAAKVPLIIKAPGISPTIVDSPVQLTDVYPTLLDLCGYSGEETRKDTEKGLPLTGQSMKQLLEGGSWEKAAYSQVYPIETEVTLPWPDCNGIQECNHWAMRYDDADGNKWRYIVYNNGNEELYNQINDPYEQTNIAQVDTTKTAELKQKLIEEIGLDEDKVGIYSKNITRKCETWCAKNAKTWSAKCASGYTACKACPQCAWKAYNP
jgi:iduronate 2-sulfatase